MINYTSQHQIKLDLFKHPFGVDLDKENRWVKLSAVIPWDKLAEVYSRKLERYRAQIGKHTHGDSRTHCEA